jgi:Family of unknown function (DUF6349)
MIKRMAGKAEAQHFADVRILKQGYSAACTTCDWEGPARQDPDQAVEEARQHEKDPSGRGGAPEFKAKRKIRRRL